MLSSAKDEQQSDDTEQAPSFEGASATVTKATAQSEPSAETAPEETKAAGDEPFPLADPGEYYTGLWCGIPRYGCPYCSHGVVSKKGDGSGAIELHILEQIERGQKSHMMALELKED